MTLIKRETLAEMRAAREAGEAIKSIAERFGVNPKTIYQRFARDYGGSPLPGPANDNNPARVTRMAARNGGGGSGTCGLSPVTLKRIPTIDGPAGVRVGVAA